MWDLMTIKRMNKPINFCSNCGTKLDIGKLKQKRISCPNCRQIVNSAGKILKEGRDLSLPQIW